MDCFVAALLAMTTWRQTSKIRRSPITGTTNGVHDGSSSARKFPRQLPGLVQEHDRRVPDPESDTGGPGLHVPRRLGARSRVHLYAGDGAEMLSPAAGRPAGCRGHRPGDGHAGGRVSRNRQEFPCDHAAHVHGGRHLLPQGDAAVYVHQDSPGYSFQSAAVNAVLVLGGIFVRVPGRTDGDGRDYHGRCGFLQRVPQSRIGRALRSRPRSDDRRPGRRDAPRSERRSAA